MASLNRAAKAAGSRSVPPTICSIVGNRLRQELGNVSIEIGFGVSDADALSRQLWYVLLKEVRAVGSNQERLDRDAQLAAVAQSGVVVMGDAHRTRVVVQPLVEC